jgi:IS5 family transposase
MKKYDQRGLFDEEFKLEKLTKKGDPLVEMNEVINWNIFKNILTKVLKKEPKGPGGRPPYDYIMMFKILILQRLYNLSDEQMEYQINDRLSFQRFLGLSLNKDVPDQNTIWLFRETLTKANAIEKLFKRFDNYLNQKGLIANKGSIVDASFVEVPRQRNDRNENKKIKNNEIPDEWQENQHKMSQKDIDARWMTKNGIKHFGYKNHIKIDRKSKLILKYKTTNASVHDSQVLEELLDKRDRHHELYADSAYSGKPIKEVLEKNKIRNRIHEKGYRNHPLTENQKEKNRKKSKVRARVEHVFGFVKNSMKGSNNRAIGIERTENIVGLINLTYNICRCIQLSRA